MSYTIRTECPADYRAVETLTRDAFWDVYAPGCTEHYLITRLRKHPDFVPELDLVLVLEGEIAANIMYTKAALRSAGGAVREILTFGPLSVHPRFQRRGLGKALVAASFERARHIPSTRQRLRNLTSSSSRVRRMFCRGRRFFIL